MTELRLSKHLELKYYHIKETCKFNGSTHIKDSSIAQEITLLSELQEQACRYSGGVK
jgi:hypothetical protein